MELSKEDRTLWLLSEWFTDKQGEAPVYPKHNGKYTKAEHESSHCVPSSHIQRVNGYVINIQYC